MASKEKAPAAAMTTPASVPQGVAAVEAAGMAATKARVPEPEPERVTEKLFGAPVSTEDMKDRTDAFGSLVEIAQLAKAQLDHGTPPPEGKLRSLLDAVKGVL